MWSVWRRRRLFSTSFMIQRQNALTCTPVRPIVRSSMPLLPSSQEGEDAFREQRGGLLVEVGKAAVGEQVPVARIQEQLRALDGFGDLAGGLEVSFQCE